ncbi:hypothetical protein ACFXPT_38170 [Streptomyces goshikiensis]|uniref:hypothetical protein n=1 Tax=Streptomyces goshikiensis TaxID=1942 RepID=UPI00368AB495
MTTALSLENDIVHATFPVDRVEKSRDGTTLFVYGKASDGSVDSDEQIVDPGWASTAVQEWLATGGNVRVQHNPRRDPAGVGVEASTDSDGATWVKAMIVEPVAKALVETGALRAYSLGIAHPEIVPDAQASGGRIVGGDLYEISLVDRPANMNCGIRLMKAAENGQATWVGAVFGDYRLLDRPAGMKARVEEAASAGSDSSAAGAAAGVQEAASKSPKGAEGTGPVKGVEDEAGAAGASMSANADFAALGALTDVGTLHDLLCPVYDPAAVEAASSHASHYGIDLKHWTDKAFDAAAASDLENTSRAVELWSYAAMLSGSDREVVDGIRSEFHESFKEANPGLTSLPEPGQLTAERFQRPYLREDRANPGTGYGGPHHFDVPTQDLEASEFRRGYLTEGHAAPSPEYRADIPPLVPYPEVAGRAEHQRFDDRGGVRTAMIALHDHIAVTFPALCPMRNEPGLCDRPPAGFRPIPTPVGAPPAGRTDLSAASRPQGKEAAGGSAKDTGSQGAGSEGLATGIIHEASWAAKDDEAVQISGFGDVATELTRLRFEISDQLKMVADGLSEIRSSVRLLSAQASTQLEASAGSSADASSLQGPVVKSVGNGPAGPDDGDGTRRMMLRELDQQCRVSSDPAQRESAWEALNRLRGLT